MGTESHGSSRRQPGCHKWQPGFFYLPHVLLILSGNENLMFLIENICVHKRKTTNICLYAMTREIVKIEDTVFNVVSM
jgi:hypothetical protein